MEESTVPNDKLGPPAPVVLAMVLCDAIHQDPATRKCTLLGTFSTINVRKFPATHRQLAVHVALTDGRGKTRIRLRLILSDDSETEVFSREGTIEFADPRVVAELNFTINNIAFQSPGEYRLQVYGNDELLKERRLHVHGVPTGDPPMPPPNP
jgi:hypothetical protein